MLTPLAPPNAWDEPPHGRPPPVGDVAMLAMYGRYAVENEKGEEETEVLPGLRIWVTLLRGGRPHTQLVDLQGAILGAFELPILTDAVT